MDQFRSHRRAADRDKPCRPITTWPLAALSTSSATAPCGTSSAIFVEEDDAQDGVDHVDGHRSPGYVISPYVKQKVNPDGTGAGVTEDSTFYTQVNMTRTIEQILGLKPMNQFDLVASPMRTLFIDNPPAANFLPWTHVPNQIPLTMALPTSDPADIRGSTLAPRPPQTLQGEP